MTESEGEVLASLSPIAWKAARDIFASVFVRLSVFSRPCSCSMLSATSCPRRRLTGGVNGKSFSACDLSHFRRSKLYRFLLSFSWSLAIALVPSAR